MSLNLSPIKRTDKYLVEDMKVHYSQPKGFVGRTICFAIMYNKIRYGHIVGGSATLHLPGRDEFFNLTVSKTQKEIFLDKIINNIFYHIEKKDGKYPIRNMTVEVLQMFREQCAMYWALQYNTEILGYESLVELPRSGEIYKRDGWVEVGQTRGETCKRISGKGSDNWGGQRVWDRENLRPKRVFVYAQKTDKSVSLQLC